MRTVIPTCGCEIRFFDDGANRLCKACDYRCETCLNVFTCQTCEAGMNRIMNTLTNMCDCMPVFHDDGVNPLCIPCTYSCVTCSHPTLCVTCPSTRTYKNGICECNLKYY